MIRRLLIIAVFALVSILCSPAANANDIEKPGRFGLGLAIGYPGLGLSTNTFVADWMSIQAELYPFYGFHGGVLAVDYLFWLHDIAKAEVLDFTWFAGPGAALVYWSEYDGYYSRHDRHDHHHHGGVAGVLKGAVGLALQFNPQPFDLVFELSPGIVVGEFGTSFWFSGMIASRYYF